MECKGDQDDHCCHLGKYGVCEFLANANTRWVCTLREQLGSWERVHVDPRYIDRVRPKLGDIGIKVDCGNWPTPGETCATCGVTGDG